jgi:hypothetical protein
MAAETTRDTIWLPKPREIHAEPQGKQYGCRNHKRYNRASETTRDTIWLPNHEGYHMAAETTRDTICLPNLEGQYGCRTTRDAIWLPNHEGYNMAAVPQGKQYGRSAVGTTRMFILPCRKLDEEEVEGQELSQWLLSLGRLCSCLNGRHS